MTPQEREHGMRMMAGSAFHFITADLARFAEFVEWFAQAGQEIGLPAPPPEVIRLVISRAHDFVAPDCAEPIEVM